MTNNKGKKRPGFGEMGLKQLGGFSMHDLVNDEPTAKVQNSNAAKSADDGSEAELITVKPQNSNDANTVSDTSKEGQGGSNEIQEKQDSAKPQNSNDANAVPDASEEGQGGFDDTQEKESMERHFFYFSESLSDAIVDFQRRVRPKEKNKNRFMRVLLHEFFSKTPEQQQRIYQAGLKKFKDKI